MKKILMRLRATSAGDGASHFAMTLICAAFLVGALAGGIAAAYGGAAGGVSADIVPKIDRAGFADAFVTMFRYPALAILCGFAVFGVVAEPLLAGVRGFFLAFAATALMRLYGVAGLLLALSASAVQVLAGIPCFLFLASQGFVGSAAVLSSAGGRSKGAKVFTSAYFFRMAAALVFLLLAALAEMYITPWLAGMAAGLVGG